MVDNYLHVCQKQFERVSEERYGSPFNLKAIEEDVQHLRSEKKISYHDLTYFTKKEHWWFDRFWILPSQSQVDAALENKTFNFWQLSKRNEGNDKEQQTIHDLLEVFRSIELVSIILRFVRPESFGIISPPVEQVLSVRRGVDAIKTYSFYLSDLRAIRDHYEFQRAADADMALWVLHDKIFSSPPKDPTMKSEFDKDPFMLRLRTKNLVSPLAEVPLSRMADAMVETMPKVAGLIACSAFEVAVCNRAKLKGVPLTKRRDKGEMASCTLEELINALEEQGVINHLTARSWHRLRKFRNYLVHGEEPAPTQARIQEFIQDVMSIEETNRELRGSPGL